MRMVRWIITDQEQKSFLILNSDRDRDRFVAAFWQQRNPTPGSQSNPFKEEHYRRIAFANQHFGAIAPGWKTDRGRVYILYGPPDSIQMQASISTTSPQKLWIYRHVQGKTGQVQLKFVDRCRCGDYRLEPPCRTSNREIAQPHETLFDSACGCCRRICATTILMSSYVISSGNAALTAWSLSIPSFAHAASI